MLLDIQKCSFLIVMGPVQQIPIIGAALQKWVFPICLCLMVFITLTDAYSRIARCFGRQGFYLSDKNEQTRDIIFDG